MKRSALVVLTAVLGIFALIMSGCADSPLSSTYQSEKNADRSESAKSIEDKYAALGDHEVGYAEFESGNEYQKYEIWFPADMRSSGETYPLVVMANGTGIKASQYTDVFTHLASWGFVVAGSEDENSRTGASSAAALDFVLKLNEDDQSEFFGKIDTAKIGIAGHSQGGVGAINAVTDQDNGDLYKAVFAASCTSRYHADELNKTAGGWSIDVSGLEIPLFMTAGTGFFDAGNVEEYTPVLPEGGAQGICPLWWLSECFENSKSKTIIARRVGKDHGDMLRAANGYMTAWFMYYLKGDESAAFFSEIAENYAWQDVKTNV